MQGQLVRVHTVHTRSHRSLQRPQSRRGRRVTAQTTRDAAARDNVLGVAPRGPSLVSECNFEHSSRRVRTTSNGKVYRGDARRHGAPSSASPRSRRLASFREGRAAAHPGVAGVARDVRVAREERDQTARQTNPRAFQFPNASFPRDAIDAASARALEIGSRSQSTQRRASTHRRRRWTTHLVRRRVVRRRRHEGGRHERARGDDGAEKWGRDTLPRRMGISLRFSPAAARIIRAARGRGSNGERMSLKSRRSGKSAR